MSKYVQLEILPKLFGRDVQRTKPAYWGGNILGLRQAQIQNSVISENSVDEWITEGKV